MSPYNRSAMLIVSIPLQRPAAYDFVLSPDGLSMGATGQAPAATLSRSAGEIVAVIPWQALSWFQVNLPKGSHSRLNAVVTSLLEERLLEDVSQLHWVLATSSKDVARMGGQTLVGICNKSWLRDALQPLHAAGLLVQRIVPELSPSIASAPVLHMLQSNQSDQALLCTSNAVLALPLQNRSLNAFDELKQSELKLRAEPAMAEKLQSLFSREAQIQTASQRYLQAPRNGWDFAQGEWQQTQGVRTVRYFSDAWNTFFRAPHWKIARYGVFAMLVVHLIGLNAWAWRLNQQMQDQQIAIKQLLQKSFPKVQLVVDAPIQMQKELQLLRQTKGAASGGDLDVMLKAWSTQMPNAAALSSIQFKNNELKINGLTSQALAQASRISWQTQGLVWKTEGSVGILKLAGQP
ncbi:MAG: hypothetical protein EXR35_03855 [Limnohabitans sp.]|nr:hypothetical protein [Limnohabitans sp.]